MNIKSIVVLLMGGLSTSPSIAAVDISSLENELDVNPVESCTDGLELYREGDLKGAIELIGLCRDEMAQMGEQLAAAAFADEILEFTGEPLRQQNALGFSQMERKYRKGDQVIDVTLSGGQGAAMMQTVIGVAGKQTRVGKHKGFIIAQNNDITIYVPIDNQALSFKSRTVDQKMLKRFAKAFLKGFSIR